MPGGWHFFAALAATAGAVGRGSTKNSASASLFEILTILGIIAVMARAVDIPA